MNQPQLTLRLDDPDHVYRPGQTLSGWFQAHEVPPDEITSIEVSVVWYTEGKGDEDLAVHFFERLDPAAWSGVSAPVPHHFRTPLPPSPLSYEGVIVKIRWCVRVRLQWSRGRDLFQEVPFRLGLVPAARAVLK